MAPKGKKSPKLLNRQSSIISRLQAFAPKAGLLLFFAIFLFSCGDRAPVDKKYLESERYQQFSEKQAQEHTLRIENYKTFEKYLSEFSQCALGKERDYPLHIDNAIADKELSTCNAVGDKYDISNFRIRSFGYSSFGDIIIRWIIVKKESIYEDTELFAATYRDGSLVSFKTVGVFRQNLQQDITTNIEVEREEDFIRIQSSMDRGVKYPINYDNVTQSTFQIDSLGRIKERASQATSYQSLPKYLEQRNRSRIYSSSPVGKRTSLKYEIVADGSIRKL